jgi:hypothetical protein
VDNLRSNTTKERFSLNVNKHVHIDMDTRLQSGVFVTRAHYKGNILGPGNLLLH